MNALAPIKEVEVGTEVKEAEGAMEVEGEELEVKVPETVEE